jgi:hypothetical protein
VDTDTIIYTLYISISRFVTSKCHTDVGPWKAAAIIDAGCILCSYTRRRPDKVDFWMQRREKRDEVRKERWFAYDISKADEFVIDHVWG